MYQLDKFKNIPGIVHGFSEVNDGNMSFVWGERGDVVKNRRSFLNNLDITPEDIVVASLRHATRMMSVNEFSKGSEIPDVDCLMTESENVFLFMLTADCLPVILYDAKKRVLALAHISRINAPKNFARMIVESMKSKYSVKEENVSVGIGPCIKKESYIFSVDDFKQRVPDERTFEGFIANTAGGKKAIDIAGYTAKGFVLAGIPEKNIEISSIDTAADKNFFSHYRSRSTGEREGRMATVVGMTAGERR